MRESKVFNISNLDYLREIPDKFFDLVVDDPPYGIGAGGKSFINGTSKTIKNYYRENDWDKIIPTKEYFNELIRVSKNQIIWGGNYFSDKLPAFRCFIFWDKTIHGNSYADGELAWTSFDMVARYYRGNICKVTADGRIHPTQKPIDLYDYIYKQFLPNGGKVFDGHLGSGSNRIAAYKAGNIDFYACEIDKGYFEESEKRFNNFVSVHSPASENPITFDGQHKLF